MVNIHSCHADCSRLKIHSDQSVLVIGTDTELAYKEFPSGTAGCFREIFLNGAT